MRDIFSKAGLIVLLLITSACTSGEKQENAKPVTQPDWPDGETAASAAEMTGDSDLKGHTRPNEGITVLIYHRFGDERWPSTNIQLAAFEKHLQFLKENDYKVLTFGKAYRLLKNRELGEGPYAVITIDDSYKSFYTGAMPLLEEYNYNATLFVNTATVGGGNYMSWNQIREVQREGIEIGNHSHSHEQFLNRGNDQERIKAFRSDLKQSMEIFEQQLTDPPEIYAYPYGEYMEGFKQVLKEEGIEAAAAQHSGVWHPDSDHWAVPRFPMNEYYGTLERFKNKMAMAPLKVHKARPARTIVGKNPPELKLSITDRRLSPNSFQCFINGSSQNCEFEVEQTDNRIELTARAKNRLTSRRTKYTITAMNGRSNQWHWYTKLWVRPDVSE